MHESWQYSLFMDTSRSDWRWSHRNKPGIAGLNFRCFAFLVLAMMMSGLHADETTITGKLQVFLIGNSDEERIALFVETPGGKLTELRASPAQKKRLRSLAGGTQVELLGKHASGGFTFSDFSILGAEENVLLAGDPDTAHCAPTFGERKVAVLLVNFQDDQSEPGTAD